MTPLTSVSGETPPVITVGGTSIHVGDNREVLRSLPAASVHTCITSPPYFGLRDYGAEGQLGAEETLAEYVANLVDVFREVRRVLRDDGTVWLNLGDSYSTNGRKTHGTREGFKQASNRGTADMDGRRAPRQAGIKAKDLLMVPARVALALQDDGWYLRSDIIWAKTNPMPGSQRDRPTSSHEHIYLLSKRPSYFYDDVAIREPVKALRKEGASVFRGQASLRPRGKAKSGWQQGGAQKNRTKRDVWSVAVARFGGAHFATFAPALIEPCVLAGTSEAGCCPACGAPYRRVSERKRVPDRPGRVQARNGDSIELAHGADGRAGNRHSLATRTVGWEAGCECDAGEPVPCTVLDPFFGAGTSGLVAARHGRRCVGIELNASYAEIARARLEDDAASSATQRRAA